MPVFEYRGFDGGGKAVSGIVDADTAKMARSRLRRQGLFPTDVDVQEKGGSATRGQGLNVEIDLTRYLQWISTRDISQMTGQLATLLGASVPMSEALAAMVDQTEKTKLKIVLSQIKEKVNEGSTLADAMKQHPRVFDDMYVQMVRAGERTGALDEVLRRLGKFSETQVKLQGEIFAAMAYPVLMALIGFLILFGLFTAVIPQIRSLFEAMPGGMESLPWISKLVFALGDFITSPWLLVAAAAIVAGIYGFRRWTNTDTGRLRFDGWRLRMPIFGKVNRLVAVSRFCRTLATLLVSGVPIVTSLQIVRGVIGNVILEDAVDKATANITEGHSIAVPLKQSGEFPPLVTHMIAIGERTGDLEPMLTKVADAYEDQVENTMQAVTSLLGPLMILALGGTVFLVAIGLLLPMLNMSSMMAR